MAEIEARGGADIISIDHRRELFAGLASNKLPVPGRPKTARISSNGSRMLATLQKNLRRHPSTARRGAGGEDIRA